MAKGDTSQAAPRSAKTAAIAFGLTFFAFIAAVVIFAFFAG
jgi:hypothetical protein